MSQNAGPSVPSSLTPIRCTTAGTSIVPLEPLARRLEAWLALPSPSRWLTRTIRLGYAIQFARRPPKFSGVLETAVQLGMLLSCARRLLSSWQGCNRAGPSSRDEAGVLQPLFHRTQGRRWYSTNPGLRLLNRALPGSRLRCWRTGAWSNAYSPGIGLCCGLSPHVTARPPSPPLESHAAQIAARCPHSGGAQSCGRRALTTAHFPRRMATPSRDDPADLESIRRSSGGPVCFSRVLPLPVVFLPDRGLPRHGRTGTQLASGSMQICISPSKPARTDTVQSQGGRGAGPAGRAVLAHPDLVSRTHSPRDSPSHGPFLWGRTSFLRGSAPLAPASRPCGTSMCGSWMGRGRLEWSPTGGVVETITQAGAPSTRQAYVLKWSLFANRCSSRREDPRRCTIGVVLSFLQERLERRLSPSTLKVFMAAIAAHHDAVDGRSLGKHDLIVRFLRGARRLNPPRLPLRPSWDLSIVLVGLQRGPCEPLDSVELR